MSDIAFDNARDAFSRPEEIKDYLIQQLDVSRGTVDQFDQFIDLLATEMSEQNLIAPSTLPNVWSRHILDSAQLLLHARNKDGLWIDIGSGGGFPGIVIAILSRQPIWLVEPRQLRAHFLQKCIESLSLDHAQVKASKIQNVDQVRADVISARAVAPLTKILSMAEKFSTPATCWLLPKGRNADKDLHLARREWRFDFAEKRSLTDSESTIFVGTVKGRKHDQNRGR